MEERDPLTGAVIAAAIEVHREMGPGLLESVYQACLEQELSARGIECLPLHKLPLVYKGVTLKDDFIIDIFVPGRLVVELKAVEKIIGVHEAQLLTYMKLTKCPVGLLLNFHVPVLRDGIKRMVL
jgi:GxxExxY protein